MASFNYCTILSELNDACTCTSAYTCTYNHTHICTCTCVHTCTVPDIIKFTYYHCTSTDYSVLYEWSTLYFKCTCVLQMYYTVLHLAITYKCKGNSHITMITVQSSAIVLLRSTVDYHLIKV